MGQYCSQLRNIQPFGHFLAEGKVADVRTPERLEQLYRAPVRIIRESGQVAFVPS